MTRREIFPGAVSVAGAALIFEGNGQPAVYLAAHARSPRVLLFRLPEAAQVNVKTPRKLPGEGKERTLSGGHVSFVVGGVRQDLALNTVGICRELLEALEAHTHALSAWQGARAAFKEGT